MTDAVRPRAVVTGGGGFIGAHVCPALSAAGRDVWVIDAMQSDQTDGTRSAIRHSLSQLVGLQFSAMSLDHAVAGAVEPADVLIHLAALPGVRNIDVDAHRRGNVDTAVSAAELAARTGVRRLVFTSSSSIYAPSTGPVDETAPLGPISPYGQSKLAAEEFLTEFCARNGLELVVVRLSTTFGPWQRSDMLFARLIAAASGGPAVTVNGDGSSVRAYVYAADVAAAIVRAADVPIADGMAVLNVGGSEAVTTAAAIDLVEDVVGRRPAVTHAPPNPVEHQSVLLECARARAVLGWAPTTTVRDGLVAQVDRWEIPAAGRRIPSA